MAQLFNPFYLYSYEFDIDLPIAQSEFIGDCWLLSAIKSISYNKVGRIVLEKMIARCSDATIVYLRGLDTFITIPNIDITQAISSSHYSQGSKTAIIIELAFEKLRQEMLKMKFFLPKNLPDYMKDIPFNFFQNKLNWGFSSQAFYCLLGKEAIQVDKNEISQCLYNIEHYDNIIACCAFVGNDDFFVKDFYGKNIQIYSRHSYSIKSVNKYTVTIVNPHHTDKDILLDKNIFVKFVEYIEYCKI